jgi:beta-galactosidase
LSSGRPGGGRGAAARSERLGRLAPGASGPAQPTADGSFSGGVFSDGGSDFGTSTTLPAAMLDGNMSTDWSNRYTKAATQTLPAVSSAHASDWVSVSWAVPRSVSGVTAFFTVDANDQLPAAIDVSYGNGSAWVSVSGERVSFATAPHAPTVITLDPVSTTKLRLDMTSASPGDPVTGNLAIAELQIPGVT